MHMNSFLLPSVNNFPIYNNSIGNISNSPVNTPLLAGAFSATNSMPSTSFTQNGNVNYSVSTNPVLNSNVNGSSSGNSTANSVLNNNNGGGCNNKRDNCWLRLEICREYLRNKCSRNENECKYAHPPDFVEKEEGYVVCCFDSLRSNCKRVEPPCKYLHPPEHLKNQLMERGRLNLEVKKNNKQFQLLQHILQPAFGIPFTPAIPFLTNNPAAASPLLFNSQHPNSACQNQLSIANNPSNAVLLHSNGGNDQMTVALMAAIHQQQMAALLLANASQIAQTTGPDNFLFTPENTNLVSNGTSIPVVATTNSSLFKISKTPLNDQTIQNNYYPGCEPITVLTPVTKKIATNGSDSAASLGSASSTNSINNEGLISQPSLPLNARKRSAHFAGLPNPLSPIQMIGLTGLNSYGQSPKSTLLPHYKLPMYSTTSEDQDATGSFNKGFKSVEQASSQICPNFQYLLANNDSLSMSSSSQFQAHNSVLTSATVNGNSSASGGMIAAANAPVAFLQNSMIQSSSNNNTYNNMIVKRAQDVVFANNLSNALLPTSQQNQYNCALAMSNFFQQHHQQQQQSQLSHQQGQPQLQNNTNLLATGIFSRSQLPPQIPFISYSSNLSGSF